MTSRRRSVIALLVTGVVGLIAFGASASAAVNTTNTTTLGIRAFVDNGFSGAVVGVPGGAVALKCQAGTVGLALQGTASNGMAKANYNDEGNGEETQSNDDLDNTDTMPLNFVGGETFDDVIGHAEFVNGAENRTLTVQYATENTPPNTTADCAVWGSAVKGLY